jgi:hypothetical protein
MPAPRHVRFGHHFQPIQLAFDCRLMSASPNSDRNTALPRYDAMGHQLTFPGLAAMSALPPITAEKADIDDVR